jgi:NADH-quinone oxidoreductase subunit L
MLGLLWLVPALPFAGFMILALIGPRLSRRGAAIVGVGAVGLSAAITLAIGAAFIGSPSPAILPLDHSYTQTIWTWINVAGFAPTIGLRLDSLSLIMILVVTFVGFFIHLYSAEFMAEEEGYSRYFAYMNLFVGSMLTLVLADNLLLLYLGWEGVGLCSYLLIGFWYKDPENGRAGRKAFVVTRIGDAAFAVGLFLLFDQLGTLHIQDLMQRASAQWAAGSGMAIAAAALLLGGAVGKSAQLPLQTWLPDAMAGPTPVSALIHAATMVTAGVYLIARTNVLFSLAPAVMSAVAIVGALTLLLAGLSGLTQWDIKRVLAYSTISQIGYMFLALGVGAWSAGIFHFMMHAFFKALLFLGAGVVIIKLEHEHNIFKMGGLRKELPLTFWAFLAGSLALSAFPLVSAGFYSKDLILYDAWASAAGSPWLWAAGLVGALLTSMYTFRLVFIVFFGEPKPLVKEVSPIPQPGLQMSIPLVVLGILSIVGGLIELPEILGNKPFLSDFLHTTLPPVALVRGGLNTEATLAGISAAVSLIGILLAYWLFYRNPQWVGNLGRTAWGAAVHHFWFVGWGFDWLYDKVVVQPYVWLAHTNKRDVVDLFFEAIAWLVRALHRLLSLTQTGRVRWYAAGIAIGAVIVFSVAVFL